MKNKQISTKDLPKDYPEIIEVNTDEYIHSIPKGIKFTLKFLCKKYNINYRTTWEKLEKMERVGLIKSHMASVKENGMLRKVRVYQRI